MSDEQVSLPSAVQSDAQQRVLMQTYAAVTALDRALAAPNEARKQIADRAEQLVAELRDILITIIRDLPDARGSDWRSKLDRVNIALSLLVEVEYPAGGNQIKALEQARVALLEVEQAIQPPRRQQLFRPSANTVAKVSIVSGLIAVGLAFFLWGIYIRSPYYTGASVTVNQPVPFSHKHHVGQLGIDCRMCHTSVEQSASAGMPATQTCMTCHSQIWANSPVLAPVHESYLTGVPIAWNRVYELPGYVYFNHSIHVQKGIGCVSCHGQVDQMPLTVKAVPLTMQWCLNCHRAPEKYIRPRDEVFNTNWVVPDQVVQGRKLVDDYHIIAGGRLTNCSICHR